MNDAKNNKNHDILFFPRRKSVVGPTTHSLVRFVRVSASLSLFLNLIALIFLKILVVVVIVSRAYDPSHNHTFKTVDPEKEEGLADGTQREKNIIQMFY